MLLPGVDKFNALCIIRYCSLKYLFSSFIYKLLKEELGSIPPMILVEHGNRRRLFLFLSVGSPPSASAINSSSWPHFSIKICQNKINHKTRLKNKGKEVKISRLGLKG